ncbi:hypothetical protein [Polaromonas sp.]|uniref:hypothetical protein n=1 Tax=Polaromonas sp. TaxID=1869339 RepID=UPI00286BDFAC|nr:hypothetical protein [Polaromonas sp.]
MKVHQSNRTKPFSVWLPVSLAGAGLLTAVRADLKGMKKSGTIPPAGAARIGLLSYTAPSGRQQK